MCIRQAFSHSYDFNLRVLEDREESRLYFMDAGAGVQREGFGFVQE